MAYLVSLRVWLPTKYTQIWSLRFPQYQSRVLYHMRLCSGNSRNLQQQAIKLPWIIALDGAPYNMAVPPHVTDYRSLTKGKMSGHQLPYIMKDGALVENKNHDVRVEIEAGVNIFDSLNITHIPVIREDKLMRGRAGPVRLHRVLITRENIFERPAKFDPSILHTGGCYVDELKQALLSAIRIQHPQLLETMIERMCRLDGRFIPFYTCPYWSEAAWVEDPWRHLKGNVKHEYINNRTIDQLLHDVLNGLYGGVSRKIGVGGDPREHPGSMQQVRVVCICALIPPPPAPSVCLWMGNLPLYYGFLLQA